MRRTTNTGIPDRHKYIGAMSLVLVSALLLGSCKKKEEAAPPRAPTCGYNVTAVAELLNDFSQLEVDNTDFDDPAWLNVAHTGSRYWRARVVSGEKFLRATGFEGPGMPAPPTEIWLITPPIQASGSPTLSFRSAMSFWTHVTEPFQVHISTDHDGCEIDDATWTEIIGYNKPTSSHNNYQWVESGNIDLVPLLPGGGDGTFHIGFRYFSVGTQTTTIDVDDISIQQ